ncbi:MAG: bifunctional serine/threonine-protein kinase/formylglycine-generating enzyme family protein [Pirellulaceae bacterium]|jgi:serine/threonine protein kinase|nr:bifunctional serine/threonine-protein kinase/formylglycine-generating enzyme family protein [Pirellulaceae bacterium]
MNEERRSTDVCHAHETLTRFSLGDLHPDRYEVVAAHIEKCVDCQDKLATLDRPSDEFVAGLQRSIPNDSFEDESRCASSIADAVSRVESVSSGESVSGELSIEQLGRYRLLEKLRSGGMGNVYKALHTKLDRVVAIKILSSHRLNDPDAIARFDREMKLIGQLQHPHIVHATDADQDGDIHYLVMELVDGIDLSRLVRKTGLLGVADACELIRQAAVGLDFVHHQGMVHRDIKPSNLMITVASRVPKVESKSSKSSSTRDSVPVTTLDPVVKILDLGLALLDHDGDGDDLTSTGQVMGTIDYMAPEQVENTHGVDIRADIFSLGATLFKLLTGEAPLSSAKYGSSLQKLAALGRDEIPSIASRRDDLPSELVTIVDRMLSCDPSDRFQTPVEVVDTLATFVDQADLRGLWNQIGEMGESKTGKSVTKPIAPTVAIAGERPRRNKTMVIGALGTLLAISVLGLIARTWLFNPQAATDANPATSANGPSVPGKQPPRAVAPFDREQAEQHQRAWANHLSLPIENENSMGMKFRLIPPGEFSMGEPKDSPGHQKGVPLCRVTLTKPFYLAKTEVTVSQFEQFARESGYETLAEKEGHAHGKEAAGAKTHEHISGLSWRNLPFPQSEDHPVLAISWHDAVAFCEWLSQKEGVTCRLPAAAEWEYACRAGTTTLYWPGDEYELLEDVAVCQPQSRGRTQPVGKKPANPFGLFDIHGNATEWPLDDLAGYTETELIDPVGNVEPTGPIATRGGSFHSQPAALRSSCRARVGGERRSLRQKTSGFRVLVEIATTAPLTVDGQGVSANQIVSASDSKVRTAIGWKHSRTYGGLGDVRSAHFNPRDGRLYCCSLKGVQRIEEDGRATQIAQGVARTLAIAPDGRTLLYSVRDESVIRQVDLNTRQVTGSFDMAEGRTVDPGGIDVPPSSHRAAIAFRLETGHGRVLLIRLDDEQPNRSVLEGGFLAMPGDVTFRGDVLYVTDVNGDMGRNTRSSLYRSDGGRLISVATDPPLEGAEGICCDPLTSDLFVVCRARTPKTKSRVVRLSATDDENRLAGEVIYSGLTLPSRGGIDISPDGEQMAITDRGADEILVFSRADEHSAK